MLNENKLLSHFKTFYFALSIHEVDFFNIKRGRTNTGCKMTDMNSIKHHFCSALSYISSYKLVQNRT